MADPFANNADTLRTPARRAVAVVPHDVNALSDIPKALYVGTGGTIVMRGVADTGDQVWKNVPAGAVLRFRAQYVRATGTTAGDMLALY